MTKTKYFSFKADENWEIPNGRQQTEQQTMSNLQKLLYHNKLSDLIVSDVDVKNSTHCDNSHEYLK